MWDKLQVTLAKDNRDTNDGANVNILVALTCHYLLFQFISAFISHPS